MHRNVFLCAVLALAAGCPTRDISQLDPSAAIEQKADIPVSSNRNIDILFVIDNSSSMSDKQDTLADNFPNFINVLQTIQGGLPNVHIAVATSDVGAGEAAENIGNHCFGFGDEGILKNGHPGLSGPPEIPCTALGGNRYIEDVADPSDPSGRRVTNYTGGLADVFSCIAKQGTTGCGFESHLEGMKQALDNCNNACAHPQNDGFLRNDAYLAVIIIGDEDDCSARDTSLFDQTTANDTLDSTYGPNTSYRCTEFGVECDGTTLPRTFSADYTTCVPRGDSYLWHPDHYVDFLRKLKGDPNLLIGAVIAGNTMPFGVELVPDMNHPSGAPVPQLKHSCSFMINGNNQVADPAIRLNYFVQQFGDQGKFVSICQSNLSDAMTKIAQLLRKVIGTPCLDGPLDLTDIDPSTPGTQLDCQVSDVVFPGRADSTETVLPRCPMTAADTPDTSKPPCWWTTIDETACKDTETHVALKVERGEAEPSIGTHELARCVLK
jgi:hypothetical protein